MSLREEIERLIETGLKSLERRDAKHFAFYERQRQRFAPLRAVLGELTAAVEREYLDVTIDEDSAWIRVGQREGSHLRAELTIRVEPNFEMLPILQVPEGESLFREAPGFRVTQTRWHGDEAPRESQFTLESEEAVAQHLVPAVVAELVHYRYLASLRARRDQGD